MAISDTEKFHWADYLLFALSVSVTIFVGIGFAVKNKWHRQSSVSYLLADRKLNWFLMSMSIIASAMSAVMIVGLTTEFYYMGLEYIWAILGLGLSITFPVLFVIPKLFNMRFQMVSGYEYFEHRFSLPVRMTVAVFYCIFTLLYMAVILYVPSLVFSQVADLNIYVAIVIGGLVCIIYTGFGGMKAVVWVDNIQILIIVISLVVLAVKGTLDAGGISHVVWRYKESHRINALDIDPSPWNRHTVWNVVFLYGFNMMGYMGTHQMVLQRYMALQSPRDAQMAAAVGIFLVMVLASLCLLISMSAFSMVGGNEPFINKEITKLDQILPYFLMKVMGKAHGLPGIVIAALFAAALSTLSSGQNALAAIFLEDFLKPVYRLKGKKLSPKVAGIVSRSTGLLWGILTLALGLVVPSMDDMVYQMARSFEAVISGPLLGVMICALFLRYIESWGLSIGLVAAFVWHLFLYPSSLRHGQKIGYNQPPVYLNNFTVELKIPSPTAEPTLYDVSYTWYVFMDATIVIVLGSVISIIVHIIKIAAKKKRFSEICSDREFCYNMHDFLVAFGVKKWTSRVQEKEVIDDNNCIKDGTTELSDKPSLDTEMGYVNPASYETYM